MKRKIYNKLLDWKNNTDNIKPLMILGARQVGKTYVINEFCEKEFKNYIHINLFQDTEIVKLYKSEKNSKDKYIEFQLLMNFDFDTPNTIIFIDEIQECEELISELKFFCEEHNNVRIICAGSLLGVKLKRSKSSFPVGKVNMIYMYPMDFEEFLVALNQQMLVDKIKECFNTNKEMYQALHERALNYYRLYLCVGGMPESVFNFVSVDGNILKYNSRILTEIVDSYFKDMDKYVNSNAEALKIERIYSSIPSQLLNNSNKFQFSKVVSGAKFRDYDTALDWLYASNMVLKTELVNVPGIPLIGFVNVEYFKLYLNDVGILSKMTNLKFVDILRDNLSLYKGAIAENYVANELVQNGINLYYWQSNGVAEVDFLIYTEDGIIPIEVKAGDSVKSKSLNRYMEKYNPSYAIRVSTRNFGFNEEKKIKSIPLYAVFCIKE